MGKEIELLNLSTKISYRFEFVFSQKNINFKLFDNVKVHHNYQIHLFMNLLKS